MQGFYCGNITFEKAVNMFESIEIAETIYEGVVEPSYKKLLDHMLTMLVSAGRREEKPPQHEFTLRWVNAMASSRKGM